MRTERIEIRQKSDEEMPCRMRDCPNRVPGKELFCEAHRNSKVRISHVNG